MIRQEGYGQIYGNMGGASVGASIYSAARENVTFARMVELQRLNLAKRELRMRQAQAAANADLSRQRINMENTRLQLEARRLDMVDKQNEEQRIRANQAYEAKMQEMELRQQQEQAKAEQQERATRLKQEQQEQAARLKQEQQMFDNGMEVSRAGGNIIGADGMAGDEGYNYLRIPGTENVARVPVAQRQAGASTAQGQVRGSVGPTENQAFRRVDGSVKNDMDLAKKSLAEKKRRLQEMESSLQRLEESYALDGSAKKRDAIGRLKGEIEAARSEIERLEGGTYGMMEKYRAALAEDSSLMQDVPYTKWRGLPWDKYDEEQRTTLFNLLSDDTADGRRLLVALVGEKEFNPWVAEAWLSAREKLGDDLAMSPEEWMKKYHYEDNPNEPKKGINPIRRGIIEGINKESRDLYRNALRQDGTILMDVDYDKWQSIRLEMDEERKNILAGLLQSESRYDRDLLSKIVSKGDKEFSTRSAYDWQNAAARPGTVARRIDPGVWMSVDWSEHSNEDRTKMCALLESNNADDADIVGAWLFGATGKQALRAGAPGASVGDGAAKTEPPGGNARHLAATEKPPMQEPPKEPAPEAATEPPKGNGGPEPQGRPSEKPSGKLDNGILVGTEAVKIVVGGQTRLIPRATWDAMTDEQREEIQKLVGENRKASKGQKK